MLFNSRIFWKNVYDIRQYLNKIRCQICALEIKNTAKKVGKGLGVGGVSSVTTHTELGDFVCFNGMKITGSGTVKIGNNFHSGINCLIITQSHNYDKGCLLPYDWVNVSKDVIIEDFVWLGSNVTILPGTIIEEGAIVQAGAVCHGVIPACSIVGGNPAKVFKYRDVDHYNKLKSEGRYNQ